jgi:hypothetical protein
VRQLGNLLLWKFPRRTPCPSSTVSMAWIIFKDPVRTAQ